MISEHVSLRACALQLKKKETSLKAPSLLGILAWTLSESIPANTTGKLIGLPSLPSPESFRNQFRFEKEDFWNLFSILRFPEVIITLPARFTAPASEAFARLLRHFA